MIRLPILIVVTRERLRRVEIRRVLDGSSTPDDRGGYRCPGSRVERAAQFGSGIEDTALLKRLVLKRCVYGVDLSAMGVEIAKVSLWLGSFVPGLSLAVAT
jgi:hypothetical protein